MANKTFNIYCDESTHMIHDGHPFMILAYVSIAYPQIKMAKEQIKSIKAKYHYDGELKWTNVHEATYCSPRRKAILAGAGTGFPRERAGPRTETARRTATRRAQRPGRRTRARACAAAFPCA